jgi:hypothetical protein
MKTSLKKLFSIAIVLISTAMLITACKKDSTSSTPPINNNSAAASFSTNGATADNAFDDAFNIGLTTGNNNGLTSLIEAKGNGAATLGFGLTGSYYCANVTVSGTSFPVTVTVDFGSGCTSADSIMRSGSITYVFSGKLSTAGTTISATFNNYVVNNYKLSGTYSIKNTSTGLALSLTTGVTNGNITYPNDTSYSFSGSKTVAFVSGSPSNVASLVFNVTGGYSISDSYGESLKATVTTPLVREGSCKHIVQGITSFTYTKGSASVNGTLDYGNGACDNLALITIGSFTETVTLP